MKELKTIPKKNTVNSVILRDEFNKIAVNIEYATLQSDIKSLIFTSALMGEGKTTVCVNVAVSLASAGKKVLLMDADLRQPRVHTYFNVVNYRGLADILIGEDKDAYLLKTEIDNLDLVTSGHKPPNPVALLSSDGMKNLIEEYKKDYDYIVIDTAPILPVPDVISMSKYIDGIVIVTRYDFCNERALKDATDALSVVNGNVIGTVLNQYKYKQSSYGSYGGYGGYGYGYGYGSGGYGNYDDEEDQSKKNKRKTKREAKKLYNKRLKEEVKIRKAEKKNKSKETNDDSNKS